jgi:predicted DNA-binding mobile mystery protein A
LAGARNLPARPSGGWIASVREALGLSLAEIGRRMRVARQNVQMFERAEANDRITLGTLRRVAGAMGCDLIYTFVPAKAPPAMLSVSSTRWRSRTKNRKTRRNWLRMRLSGD